MEYKDFQIPYSYRFNIHEINLIFNNGKETGLIHFGADLPLPNIS